MAQIYTKSQVPGWAVYGWGVLLILLQLTVGCFSVVLNLMSQRNSLDFIPIRDYRYFVEAAVRLAGPAAEASGGTVDSAHG